MDATRFPEGFAGTCEWTDHECEECKRQGIVTIGGYTPHLKRHDDGHLECDLSHRPTR